MLVEIAKEIFIFALDFIAFSLPLTTLLEDVIM